MANILAVDDEITCLEIIRFALSSRGHTVYAAENGREAINFLKENQHKIDLILLDMMMPGLDGIKTLEEIRKIDYASGIPVIFQTGIYDYNPTNLSESNKTDFIIRKPYKRDELTKLIADVLKQNEITDVN